jgi:hypothetical protein
MFTKNRIHVLLGILGLLFGSLVYLIDRPPEHTYFISTHNIHLGLYYTFPKLFGLLGHRLPSFIHVFSFALITAGLFAHKRKEYLGACFLWFLIDCAFELGQKFDTWSAGMIPDWFGGIPYLENTKNYFSKGTFDFGDVAAIALGAVVAYLVLIIPKQRRDIT